jgi:hypothetical protein
VRRLVREHALRCAVGAGCGGDDGTRSNGCRATRRIDSNPSRAAAAASRGPGRPVGCCAGATVAGQHGWNARRRGGVGLPTLSRGAATGASTTSPIGRDDSIDAHGRRFEQDGPTAAAGSSAPCREAGSTTGGRDHPGAADEQRNTCADLDPASPAAARTTTACRTADKGREGSRTVFPARCRGRAPHRGIASPAARPAVASAPS